MSGMLSIAVRWNADSPSETHTCIGCGEQIWLREYSLEICCTLFKREGGWKAVGLYICEGCHEQVTAPGRGRIR